MKGTRRTRRVRRGQRRVAVQYPYGYGYPYGYDPYSYRYRDYIPQYNQEPEYVILPDTQNKQTSDNLMDRLNLNIPTIAASLILSYLIWGRGV